MNIKDINDTFSTQDRMQQHQSKPIGSAIAARDRKDFFIRRDDYEFAGMHLIIDLFGASNIDSLEHMEEALREAVEAAGATLLHIHLHHFTPNGGISGVAVLAESHISVHTWPERQFAAFDVFMCGDARPADAVPVLERFFSPSRTDVQEYVRGRMPVNLSASV